MADDTPSSDKWESMKTSIIKIGAHCWIGENSLILADVGNNSIIGGGGVVVKAIPENVVAVGNPATVVRTIS